MCNELTYTKLAYVVEQPGMSHEEYLGRIKLLIKFVENKFIYKYILYSGIIYIYLKFI